MLDELAGDIRETACLSARFELGHCQGILTCDEFDALQEDLPNPCSAEDEEVETLCESP
jgi:hypothetical protein